METAVREAVQALYSPTSPPESRQSADRFLAHFQNTPDAWNVAVGLMTSDDQVPYELVLFAAQTIKHKVIRSAMIYISSLYVDCF